MPMSRRAMLIAAPIPRVPPVTIATRAIMSSFWFGARLFRGKPACKLTLDQPFEHGDAFGRIVEAVEQRKRLAARLFEGVASPNAELLECLDAVGRKSRRRDRDALDAVLWISRERCIGRRLEPLRTSEFGLERNVDFAAERLAEQPRRLLAVAMIG